MNISLSRGLTALVDDDDVDLVAGYSWYANATSTSGRYYAYARVPDGSGRRVSMHRLICAPPPGMVIHHINNDGLDNRRSNLCVVTTAVNLHAHYFTNTAGVHLHKQTGKFRGQTRINGIRFDLGLFDRREDAEMAVAMLRSQHSPVPAPSRL